MKLVADCHFHTVSSGHAYSTLKEYAKEASDKGLELIAITDHGPAMPGGAHIYYFHNLKILPDCLYNVEILKGAEANLISYDGELDLADMDLGMLDVLIASHHLPCLKAASAKENTQALINSMKNKFVNIIGHPDDGRIPLDYDELTRAAAEYGIMLELNNSSLRPISFRKNARENYMQLLEKCEKNKVFVVVNTDSHIHTDIGEFNESVELIKKAGFPKELVANTSVERLKRKLAARRNAV